MTMDVSELARQLAARRRPKQVICPVCNTQVVGIGRRKYCGERCAKLAWWRRHRAKASVASEAAKALHVWDDDGGAGEARNDDRQGALAPADRRTARE
jgi:endogenous inhibitor of DNA gyrase (YacG/DUF329 family)